jgi:hypothetical protein
VKNSLLISGSFFCSMLSKLSNLRTLKLSIMVSNQFVYIVHSNMIYFQLLVGQMDNVSCVLMITSFPHFSHKIMSKADLIVISYQIFQLKNWKSTSN